MTLFSIDDRFYYMRGYFERVCAHPENYLKEDLIRYFKVLAKFFDSPSEPMDDSIL